MATQILCETHRNIFLKRPGEVGFDLNRWSGTFYIRHFLLAKQKQETYVQLTHQKIHAGLRKSASNCRDDSSACLSTWRHRCCLMTPSYLLLTRHITWQCVKRGIWGICCCSCLTAPQAIQTSCVHSRRWLISCWQLSMCVCVCVYISVCVCVCVSVCLHVRSPEHCRTSHPPLAPREENEGQGVGVGRLEGRGHEGKGLLCSSGHLLRDLFADSPVRSWQRAAAVTPTPLSRSLSLSLSLCTKQLGPWRSDAWSSPPIQRPHTGPWRLGAAEAGGRRILRVPGAHWARPWTHTLTHIHTHTHTHTHTHSLAPKWEGRAKGGTGPRLCRLL